MNMDQEDGELGRGWMDSPRVSVIIPTHNLGHLLSGAIESVLAQSFTDWELIVVDDASTDRTGHIVRQYLKEPRMRYLRLEQNAGPSAARNRGIANTTGDLLSFLDADDRWLPTKLERQVAVFQDETVSVCGVAAYEHHPGGRTRLRRKVSPFEGDSLFLELLFRNTIPGSASAVMVRRDCFSKVGLWDESLRGGEDRDLWLRLASRYRFSFIDAPLVRIDRRREDRATRNWKLIATNRETYLRKREQDLPDRFRKHLPDLRHRTYYAMAKYYFRSGDVRNGRRYSLRAAVAPRRMDGAFWNSCTLLFKSFVQPQSQVLGVRRRRERAKAS
jgi:glycosyltransferase involved in cell wall biosynthesis